MLRFMRPALVTTTVLTAAIILALVLVPEGWLGSSEAANTGSLLSGAGTVLAAAVALLLIPSEAKKWRQQKRDELIAQAAGDALTAVHRIAGAIRNIRNPLSYAPVTKTREESAAAMRTLLQDRFKAAEPDARAFGDAWTKANVYLDEKAASLMQDLWKRFLETLSSAEFWLDSYSEEDMPKELRTEARNAFYGKEADGKLQASVDAAVEHLKPLARLEDAPARSSR